MDDKAALKAATLKIFHHHLYELSKGLRPLAMMTMTHDEAKLIVAQLVATETAYHVQEVCLAKINVVFGSSAAVATARTLLARRLCNLTPERDFMLGILLGYDREQQCTRYLARIGSVRAETSPGIVSHAGMLH